MIEIDELFQLNCKFASQFSFRTNGYYKFRPKFDWAC
jgi:hypothetical protein